MSKNNPVKTAIRKACAIFTSNRNVKGRVLPASVMEWNDRGDRALQVGNRQHYIAWNRTGGYPMIVGPALSDEQQAAWEPIKLALLKLAKAEGVRVKEQLLAA